ncbi:hypothetical protein PGB90_001936 [Kerria lacca]
MSDTIVRNSLIILFISVNEVILWIRLSVIFGYPATLSKLRTISKVFESIPGFIDMPHTLPIQNDASKSIEIERYSTQSYDTTKQDAYVREKSKPSPHFTHYPSDTTHETNSNETQIISIVRVSSTSVVKPKTKSNERISITVSTSTSKSRHSQLNNDINADRNSVGKNKSENGFEELVTPFVSLLRKNRLDIDEHDPKETLSVSSSSTSIGYIPDYKMKLSEMTLDLNSSFESAARKFDNSEITRTFPQSKSTANDETNSTDWRTEQYTDAFTEEHQTSKKETSDNSYFDSYDEKEYSEQRMYGEAEKIYAEPEKVYGEPEKMYGEPEKIYGEPEKVYGEPEKVYGKPENVYGEPEKSYSESENEYSEAAKVYEESEKPFKSEMAYIESENEDNEFQLPESSEMNSKSYSSFTTKINDKKSSYIVDNGTYRKYRVEQKTPDGFIVGEYGMVSHRDGSLRGVRYTADSNINPSLIYETLGKEKTAGNAKSERILLLSSCLHSQ